MIDEVEKHILAPVDVVQDDDERAGGGNGLEQPSHRPGDLLDRRHQAAVAEHRLDRARRGRIQPDSASRSAGSAPSNCFSTSTTGQYVIPSP